MKDGPSRAAERLPEEKLADDAKDGSGPDELGFSPDRPGSDPGRDRLGRAPFAANLAKSIARLPSDNGLVIALYGAWGSGKTTTLNYTLHFLQGVPDSDKLIVFRFNPWWFSGTEDLIRAFFGQLRTLLGERGLGLRDLGNKVADLTDLVSKIPAPQVAWLSILVPWLRSKPKSLAEVKAQIVSGLGEKGRRILVVMDDIDRLPADEIRQIFQLVKGLADFPNVTYLMAFDRCVVSRALGNLQGTSGNDYLRKIVQVEFELPLPDKLSLRMMLTEELNQVLSGTALEPSDQTRWQNFFYEGIDPFMNTPRDVIRLSNALAATFPAVLGEVNPVDFIAIEAIRLFCPDVYDTIRRNMEMFAGGAPGPMTGPSKDELLKFHNEWLEDLRSREGGRAEAVKDMLSRLFPGRLQAVWNNTQYGPDWESEWRRKLLVCSEDVFPVYFALAVPRGEISNSELQAILGVAHDKGAFSNTLLRMVQETMPDGKTRVSAFLDRLQDFTTIEIPAERIEPIVSSLLDVGDKLIVPGDEGRGFFEFGNEIQIGRVIWQLLKRLDAQQRFDVLQRAFGAGRAVYQMQHTVVVLGQQQGKYPEQKASPESEWLVTPDQLEALEAAVVERLRAAALDGSLLDCPRIQLVLNFWRARAGPEEVKAWANRALQDDAGLAKFLERSLQTSASFSFTDRVSRTQDRLDPKWLEEYLDQDEAATRIRRLLEDPNALNDRQARAMREYLREYDMRKRGEDPNSPFALHSR